MDKILMSNLGFYGYHGLLKEEAVLGQKFFIDIELYLDTKEAGETDDMYKSVSYADVYEVVKEIVENKRFNLLEALAENIASEVLEKFDEIPFGYGVEVGMTIDILKYGYRIKEVLVNMTHSETGRDLQGFIHRGKQYYHIKKVLRQKKKEWR